MAEDFQLFYEIIRKWIYTHLRMMVIQNSCFFIMFFYIFSISTNFIVWRRNLHCVLLTHHDLSKREEKTLINTVRNNWVSTRPCLCSKWAIFKLAWQMLICCRNSFYDQILLKYVGYHSSRDLGPNFSVPLEIQAFKVKIAKKMDILLSKIKNS